MSNTKHIAPLAALCCAMVITACNTGDKAKADDSAAAAAATAAASRDSAARAKPALSLAQLAGKWNVRSVPESGTDTTATLSVWTATADTTGWTITFPNRQPTKLHARVSGDSVITVSEPYQSVRRKGLKVVTNTTMRMQGDSLVGTSIAHYTTTGPDSVLRLKSVGKRAP